ncbi:hypothetical protein SAMD00023353_7700300 [Rosellinia necatrix]|uniref:Uncharacterized protein n=1 Tax=Rosellinia necatrix TaxID=77044 RepID=A0A1S8AAL5_ROSNE|nr:hypothetical protein SAMD00023353_7700300 [Rosellinia necatrix]
MKQLRAQFENSGDDAVLLIFCLYRKTVADVKNVSDIHYEGFTNTIALVDRIATREQASKTTTMPKTNI